MNNGQALSSEKRFLSPRRGSNPKPSDDRGHAQTIELPTCTSAHHLSLGSSMVRPSHRSSEGCGLDPRLGLRNRFSEDRG